MSAFFREVARDLYTFFTSVTLAVVLISLIALLALVGTLIPQETFTREVDYIARYGVEGYNTLKKLQLTNIFGSWYFLFVMALFTLNLSACTYKRLIASWRYWKLPMGFIPPDSLRRFEHSHVISGPVAPEGGPKIRALLQRHGYRLREQNSQILAEKWRWERFGIDVFHISLLIVIGGGLVTMLFGYRTFEIAHQGDIIRLPGADFAVRVNRFWSENYQDSERVMDWHTELTVIENDKEILTKTIEVNAPLRYKGYNVYQSAFGTDWQGAARVTLALVRADGTVLGEFVGTVTDGFEVPSENIFVKIGAFLPDFALTENLIAYSRTQRLENPAVFVEIYDAHGLRIMRTWAFSRPEMQTVWETTMARVGGEMPYRVKLIGMTAPEFTGLQITKDPGRPVVYFGFLLVILGLLVHMYFKHRQIWVHIAENEIVVAGTVRNNLKSFAEEFRRLVAEIERLQIVTHPEPELVA
ncbi:MAG: cytochrome c biogenesis protein ResB [Candidatus Bipolaricaulota bacterium]|nr:cytochrome c biogenesis protein ResB [Candidatus Bipolaricaulota bacterium]